MNNGILTSIIGVTSYTGSELARLILSHPSFTLCEITARSAQRQSFSEVFPHLGVEKLAITEQIREAQLVFVALPHGVVDEVVPSPLADGRRVVDLSADFRLRDAQTYATWYGHIHPFPQLLEEAVYGLCELRRDELHDARLVGNPGCYPTATILALAPVMARGIIKSDIIVDAKSGVSGSGRSLSLTTHYSEINENLAAYGLDGHRHTPEMDQELTRLAGNSSKLRLTFIPHLAAMTRGILATCYADLVEPLSDMEIRALYAEFYGDSPFVWLGPRPPETKWTVGSNSCLLSIQRLIIVLAALSLFHALII